jgi:RNA polymerase sigma-70 factor (ECF subfamily)
MAVQGRRISREPGHAGGDGGAAAAVAAVRLWPHRQHGRWRRSAAKRLQWRPGTRLDSWLYRILQNLWIDQIRSGWRREIAIGEDEMAAIPGGDQAREMEAKLGLAAVRREIAKLPAEQRAVLLLVSVEGASYKDAAEILEIPIGTVMSRLSRARLTLGQSLEDRGGAEAERAGARS